MSIYTPHQRPGNWEDCTRNSDDAESEFGYMLQNIQSWEDNKNGTIDGLFDDYRSGKSEISDSLRNRTTRILELGPGGGEFLNMLSKKGFRELVGIDVRPRHKCGFTNEEIEVIQQDFTNIDNLRRLHGRFDIVYSKLIFDSHRYNPSLRQGAIRSAHQLLREGGLYYCLGPHDLHDTAKDVRSIRPRQHTLIQGAINYIPPEA